MIFAIYLASAGFKDIAILYVTKPVFPYHIKYLYYYTFTPLSTSSWLDEFRYLDFRVLG
jgi:hypothetical protein